VEPDERVTATPSPAPADKASWRRWAMGVAADLVIDHASIIRGLRAFIPDASAVGGDWILTFRPMAGEVDLDALLHDHRCAITRTHTGGRLTIHPADAPTERHRWGYLQPVANAAEIDPADIAVALVPGVAFDVSGHRLGHGAGYYDRLLPRLRAGVARVGVTPAALVVAGLAHDAHDVVMTHLATEAGVRSVHNG
jgi:5-formyltetrahydrofolate cyclo-ligase